MRVPFLDESTFAAVCQNRVPKFAGVPGAVAETKIE
jgi:hypothetical protein